MNILNYYASGITSRGFVSLLDNNLEGIDTKIYIAGDIDYRPLINKAAALLENSNTNIHYLHNPFVNGFLEAMIDLDRKRALVFNINREITSNSHEIINFNDAIIPSKKNDFVNAIEDLDKLRIKCLESVYYNLGKALKTHDEWEKIYIDNMNFIKTEALAEEIKRKLIIARRDRKAIVKHRYIGALTPDGAIDFVPDITYGINKRYFIKGRPGTGKSTLLKKIAAHAEASGWDTEIYHCGFDPNSLDMVVIRELSVCIFDSTSPHEHFPEKEEDEIIDIYKIAVNPNTDEIYSKDLNRITLKYREYIKAATSFLKTANNINNEIINLTDSIIDRKELDRLYLMILDKLIS